MLFKKTVLVSSAVALLSLPIIASADLDTYNYTDEASSVKIQSNGRCSGPSRYTPPFNHSTNQPGESHTAPLAVRLVCGSAKGICVADMYPSTDCSGSKIATVSIDLASLVVSVNSLDNPKYNLNVSGSRVEMKYS